MCRVTTPTFITELPLRVTTTILVRLEFARQLYNACLREVLRRLALMRQSKGYQSARYIAQDEDNKQERRQVFADVRNCYGLREYDLHAYAATNKIGWIGSPVVQKVATRAFLAANRYAFGKAGKPRFKSQGQWDSVEGKQNTVLRWNGKEVMWGGLVLPAIFPKEGHKGNDVIEHGRNAPFKYVLLVRRKLNGKNRFYAQLVCEGLPYHKPKHAIGQGAVGIDIGPYTIAFAVVSTPHAALRHFCNDLQKDWKNIRQILSGSVGRLVVTNKDRLLRFGSELVFSLCEAFQTEVVIINQGEQPLGFEEKLAQDVLEIITVFSARLYGSRSHKNRKLVKTLREAAEQL